MQMKFGMRAFAIIVVLMLIISGCSNGNGNGNTNGASDAQNRQSTNADQSKTAENVEKEQELEHVELTWYYRQHNGKPADLEMVQDAVNKYLKENTSLNATLIMKPVDSGNYELKMNAAAAAQEEFDIVWNGFAWNYLNNVEKGAFVEIEDMLKQYAPKTYELLPEYVWDDARAADGGIYGIPNYQNATTNPGFIVMKKYVDKYKNQVDIMNADTFEEWGKFFELIKQYEPGMLPLSAHGIFLPEYYGIDSSSNVEVYLNDKDFKVVEYYFTPEFEENIRMNYDWYKKGYISSEVITATNRFDLDKKGIVVAKFDIGNGPGTEAAIQNMNGGEPVVIKPMWKPKFQGVTSTMTSVSNTSKNPERAIMLLELVNTDKELYNLLVHGIEGIHYKKLDGNYYEPIPDTKYKASNWIIGNTFNGYLEKGSPEDLNEQAIELNETAWVSQKQGFRFDSSPVQAEMANISTVKKEFEPFLRGAADPDEYLPKFREALKSAGIDRVIEEQQKQLDVFLKAKGLK